MLYGTQIKLRPLVIDDVTDEYIKWMNDYEVVKYTESRFKQHTRESIMEFVNNANNKKTHTFAIIANDYNKHIGNIKIGNINWISRNGDIGLIIGRKEYYGRGIATEAIRLVTQYAFEQLNLNKVRCGIYAPNIGSIKAFQKAGWEIYLTKPKMYLFEDEYVDCLYLRKINNIRENG